MGCCVSLLVLRSCGTDVSVQDLQYVLEKTAMATAMILYSFAHRRRDTETGADHSADSDDC